MTENQGQEGQGSSPGMDEAANAAAAALLGGQGNPAAGGADNGQGNPGQADGDETADDNAGAEALAALMEADPEELARRVMHWRTIARKLEREGKPNADAAAELRRLQDAGKSEVQRAQDAQAAAEAALAESQAQHHRVMAAAAFSLPPEMIEHLGGGTEDEITARAETISKLIDERAQKKAEEIAAQYGIRFGNGNGGMRPVESLRSGASPTGSGPVTTEQYFRQLLGRGE